MQSYACPHNSLLRTLPPARLIPPPTRSSRKIPAPFKFTMATPTNSLVLFFLLSDLSTYTTLVYSIWQVRLAKYDI